MQAIKLHLKDNVRWTSHHIVSSEMFDFLIPTVIAGAIPAAVHLSGGSRDETLGSALIYPTYLAAKYHIKRRFSQYLLKDASMDTINLPSVTSHNKRRFMVSYIFF